MRGIVFEVPHWNLKERARRAPGMLLTIRRMLETPVPAKKPIGFHAQPELTAKSAQTNGGKHK